MNPLLTLGCCLGAFTGTILAYLFIKYQSSKQQKLSEMVAEEFSFLGPRDDTHRVTYCIPRNESLIPVLFPNGLPSLEDDEVKFFGVISMPRSQLLPNQLINGLNQVIQVANQCSLEQIIQTLQWTPRQQLIKQEDGLNHFRFGGVTITQPINFNAEGVSDG